MFYGELEEFQTIRKPSWTQDINIVDLGPKLDEWRDFINDVGKNPKWMSSHLKVSETDHGKRRILIPTTRPEYEESNKQWTFQLIYRWLTKNGFLPYLLYDEVGEAFDCYWTPVNPDVVPQGDDRVKIPTDVLFSWWRK